MTTTSGQGADFQIISSCIARATTALDTLDALVGAGWVVINESLQTIEIELDTRVSTGSDIKTVVDALGFFVTNSTLELTGPGFRVAVECNSGSTTARAETDPDGTDSQDKLDAITAGDIDTLWSLDGSWSGGLALSPATELEAQLPRFRWRILRHRRLITKALCDEYWYNAYDWFNASLRPMVVLAREQVTAGDTFSTSALLATSMLCDLAELTDRLYALEESFAAAFAVSASLRAITGRTELRLLPPSVLWTQQALPPATPGRSDWEPLARVLHQFAGAHALAWLSSGVAAPKWPQPTVDVLTNESNQDASHVVIVGLQQISIPIPHSGLALSHAAEALGLHWWAVADQSPDRVLAVRQVLSLAQRESMLSSLNTVRASAEPLYLALRRDTIDAVFQAQRQARQFALDAAHKTVDFSQTAAKSAAERVLPALAGLGGVSIAQASAKISTHLAHRLGLMIACYLGIVALWVLLVEGPGLTAPLSELKSDLNSVGDVLTEQQRDEILKLASVRMAKQRARVVRIVAPITYLLVGAIVATLSVPSIAANLHMQSLLS